MFIMKLCLQSDATMEGPTCCGVQDIQQDVWSGHNHDSLVSQALNCGLIKDLLNILGSSLDNVPNT